MAPISTAAVGSAARHAPPLMASSGEETDRTNTANSGRRRLQRHAMYSQAGFAAFASAIGAQGDELLQLYSLQVFNLGPREIGLAIGLLMLAVPLQLAGVYFVETRGVVRVLRIGFLIRLALVALLATLPAFFALSRDAGYVAFVMLLVAVNAVHLGTFNTAWPPLMREITVQGERGRFLSRVRFVNQLTSICFIAAMAALVTGGMQTWHYYLLIAALLVYCANTCVQMTAFAESSRGGPNGFGEFLSSFIASSRALLFRDRFAVFLGIVVLSRLCFFPLATTYGKQVVGLSDSVAAAAIAAMTAGGMIALLLWGQLIDRCGAVLASRAATIGMVTVLAAWAIATSFYDARSLSAYFVATLVGVGVCEVGISLALFTECFDRVGPRNAPTGFVLFSVLLGFPAYLLQFLAGQVIGAAATPSDATHGYGWLLLAAGVAGAGGIVLRMLMQPRSASA